MQRLLQFIQNLRSLAHFRIGMLYTYIGSTSFNPYVGIVSFAYFQRQSECAYTQSVLICGGGARSYRCQMKFSK